jgi:hypothetical protein
MPRFHAFGPLLACLAALAAGEESEPRHRDGSVGVFSELAGPAITLNNGGSYTKGPDYEPNNDMAYGFTVRYKNYSVAVGSPLFGTSRFDAARPATRFFDLRLGWLADDWGVEAYHQYHRGFYATTADDDTLLLDNPRMTLRSNVVNVYRALGSFSRVSRMRDGLLRTGLQPNVYLVGGVSRQAITSPVPLLDTLSQGRGTPFEHMHRLAYTGAYGGMGLTLNSNLLGFYLDPTLMMGFGMQWRDSDADIERAGAQVKINLKLQAGFATERFNVGMSVENDANSVEMGEDYGVLFHSIVVRLLASMAF